MPSKKKPTTKALIDMRQRLKGNTLTKSDIATIDELLVSYIDVLTIIENSKEQVGGKTLITRLPFGFDIVK